MATLATPTLQKLISDVRVLLNQRDPLNSFWQDDEISEYLNEGIRMHFLEAAAANEGLFVTQTELDIVSGTDTVALPTDFFELRAVYKKVSDGYILLPYRNNMTEGYTTTGANVGNNYLPYYYFRGNSLILRPAPAFSETAGLRIEYISFPDTMIWGGDALTSQVSPVFKQLIVAYAVYKAKFKESLVNGVTVHEPAEQHLAAMYQSFKNAVAIRSKNPTYIQAYNPETEGL